MLPKYCEGCKKITEEGKCGWYDDPAKAIVLTPEGEVVRGCINSLESRYQVSMKEAAQAKQRVGQQKGRRGKKRR